VYKRQLCFNRAFSLAKSLISFAKQTFVAATTSTKLNRTAFFLKKIPILYYRRKVYTRKIHIKEALFTFKAALMSMKKNYRSLLPDFPAVSSCGL